MDHAARATAAESQRLAAVYSLGLLDSPSEDRFDRITSLAARLLGMPLTLITLVDRERQWNKSISGEAEQESPLSHSICRHVVADDTPLLVPDLRADPRFADHPYLATGARFYAGWPLRSGAGLPVGTLCVLDDEPRVLTAEQQELMQSLADWAQAELNAEALTGALRLVGQAEERLLSLLDGAPAAVLLVSAVDGRVEWVNTPARRMFGRSALAGTRLEELLPTLVLSDLGAQGRRATDARYRSGRRLVQAGVRVDGSRFVAELTVSVEGGSDQGRYVVFVRDLEDDHDGAAQLAALRERTDVVLDALAEGVLGVEADGTLSFGNLAAAQMLRRRRSDLPGALWHDVLHADRCPREPCELADPLALAGRTLSSVELRRADGSTLPVELSVRMTRDDGTAGVVMTLHDLTERLRVERLKNELVSAVSHELRTPLTSIRGSLSLLQAGVVDPGSPQGARMLDIAAQSTERLSRLVNDILDLERLQAGRVELVLARHRAAALLRSAAQAVGGAALAAGVTIDVRDGDAWVLADSDRVAQVLVNLLGNAVKFSPSGSTITMTATQVGDRVELCVADQGRGIPAEQLERIFDRFAQVDGGDSREFDGTGLGLAIAKGLAEQHGGTLRAESTVDVGSTFVLSLPVAPRQRRLLAYAPATEVPDGLRAVLAGRGWQTVAADTVAALARSGAGALLVAPGEADGAAELRARAAELHLPLLVLTTAGSAARDVVAGMAGWESTPLRGRVLLAESDDTVADDLSAALRARGLLVGRTRDPLGTVSTIGADAPDLLLLDLRLAGGDGYEVVEELHALPGDRPVLVYAVLQPDEAERVRLEPAR